MHSTHKPFFYFLNGFLLAVGCLLATSLPAVAGQLARDGALFAEPRLDSAPFNQATRFTGNPDSIPQHPYGFTEPGYLTGMNTRLLAKNGATPAGGAAKAPAGARRPRWE